MAEPWWWLAMALGACANKTLHCAGEPVHCAGEPAPRASPEPVVVVKAPTAVPPAPEPPEVSEPDVPAWAEVTRNDHLRRVLYTWTTHKQLEVLRKHRRLLFRRRSDNGQIALFDLRLQARGKGDDVAKLLLTPPLHLRRFAWSNPWATVLGWGKGMRPGYGDVLVRVTLRPDAIIASLQWTRWVFHRLDGTEVSFSDLLAHPEKLGAIYHPWLEPPVTTVLGKKPMFREFVLPNESMIELWEVATPAVHEALDRGAAYLAALAKTSPKAVVTAKEWDKSLLGSWGEVGPSPVDRYRATLALSASAYMPQHVARLARALRANRQDFPPLDVTVTTPYGAPLPKAIAAAPPLPPLAHPCRFLDPTMGCVP